MRFLAIILALSAIVATPIISSTQGFAQSNNNDYTPLGSRIRRDRQFPTSLQNPHRGEVGSATHKKSRAMMGRFTRCIYKRSGPKVFELLETTDYGLLDFSQLDLETDRAMKIYGFTDCLRRVAQSFNSGVRLSFSALGLRRWFLEQAYLVKYEDGPSWVKASYIIGERTYPLSPGNQGVAAAMDLADCIIASNPFAADFLYRTEASSEEEGRAIQALVPSVQPCLPDGQRVEINADTLRMWVGEGLWHAANNNAPPPAETSQESE